LTDVKFRSDCEVSLEDFMGGDDRVCLSAWVSFGNDDTDRLADRKAVERLIKFLHKNKHMTPFESTQFTFRIKTPIFVARELFRHRSASYNEWSGRYSQMLPEFYLPDADRPLVQEGKPGDYYFVAGTEQQYADVSEKQAAVFQQAWNAYETLLESGVAKEVARNVLPLATYTYFYVTMNARNLMHFLELRNDSHALYEIRAVARKMEEIFAAKMPLTYAAYADERYPQQTVNIGYSGDERLLYERIRAILEQQNKKKGLLR